MRLLQYLSLQAEAGAALAALMIAVIISFLFYGLQRRSISKIKEAVQPLRALDPKIQYDVSRIDEKLRSTCDELTNIKIAAPHTTEVAAVQQNLQSLCADFDSLKSTLGDEMAGFKRERTVDMDKMRREMESEATKRVTEHAHEILAENSVPREEFNRLRDRLDEIAGSDEVPERMSVLASLFDSKQIRTLNWQCRVIKLLKGGLAPSAEEDLLVSEGITMSSCKKFLKKLESTGIADHKTVSAFYISPDYEWLYSYVDKPDWLQERLNGLINKEKEYQEYLSGRLDLVESGLLLESSEYPLASGNIDFLCRDSSGRAVGLELKYPVASTAVKRQISGYRDDYAKKTGGERARFIVVAPKIPDKLKEMLREDGLEYREIQFHD